MINFFNQTAAKFTYIKVSKNLIKQIIHLIYLIERMLIGTIYLQIIFIIRFRELGIGILSDFYSNTVQVTFLNYTLLQRNKL